MSDHDGEAHQTQSESDDGVADTESVEVLKTKIEETVVGAVETASVTVEASERVELTEAQVDLSVSESIVQLSEQTSSPSAPTESYIHPVTGREVYVPKPQKEFGPAALLSTMSLLMFVGGGLATLMMVARAFNLHGDVLVSFVIGSCAIVLGMAGGLLLKSMGDKFWLGAVLGACFGIVGGILIYSQTNQHAWWH